MERLGRLSRCTIFVWGTGFFLMTASTEYRRYAEACLEIAEAAGDERTRALFIHMAQVWFRLSEDGAVQPENPLGAAD